MRINDWLKYLATENGSDLYLSTGAPPCAKFQGQLKPIGSDVLQPGEIREIATEVMDDTQRVIRYFPTRRGVKMYNRLGTGPQTAIVRWDAQGLGSRNLTYSLCAPGAERNWSVVLNRLGRPHLVADWGRCPG